MRKYKKQLLDAGLDSLKTAFKKVFHKTDKFLRNKIADAVKNLETRNCLKNNYSARKMR